MYIYVYICMYIYIYVYICYTVIKCNYYYIRWDISTEQTASDGQVTCSHFKQCDSLDFECFRAERKYFPNPAGTFYVYIHISIYI
jgi:hypothetical protein